MSDLQTLDSLLSSLLQLKPPGVSKSRVDAITKICTTAQIDRTQIIDTILAAFSRAPATHKLGALYVADSVVRLYIAGGSNQGLNNGTAIQKLTAHMPNLLDEITKTIPEEQKPRLLKLIDIWLGSKTFSADMLTSFKQRLETSASAPIPSTSTPSNGYAYSQPAVATPSNVIVANPVGTPSAVSQAQFPPPNPLAAVQALAAFQGVPVATQNGNGQPQPPPVSYAQAQAPVIPPPAVAAQNQAAVAQNSQAPVLPALNPAQLQAIQSVVQANPTITAEGLMQILAAMGVSLPPAPAPQMTTAQSASAPVALPPQPPQYGHPGQDQQAYQRDRSRSPDYKRRRVTPPARRESPTYGTYDPNTAKSETPRGASNDLERRERERGRGKGRDNTRKRSPPRERLASPSLMGRNVATSAPKPFGHDPSLPNGKIRVLSRTLFVGGVSGSTNEDQLMDYIARYARVQSCIVNHDKRHAFLKLISHQDAINAKQAIDSRPEAEYRSLFERMNWAVGFGPTQFADYKKGESVLPIDVLTDADRKWMKTAEFGGTGGLEIMTGMIVEEPDIEIGAGPSSKAISRRGGKSGFNNRNKDNNDSGNSHGGRRDRNRGGQQYEENARPGGGGAYGSGYSGGGGGGYGAGYSGGGGARPAPPMVETHMPEPVNIGPPPPVPQFGALPFQFGGR